jgi:hypothetical protein
MLTDQVLADAAAAALVNADNELSSTDISTSLSNTSTPTLIFASNTDSVAPYAKYQTFDSDLIKVIEVKNRQHDYMSMIGQQEHQVIVDWMEKWGAVNRPQKGATKCHSMRHISLALMFSLLLLVSKISSRFRICLY